MRLSIASHFLLFKHPFGLSGSTRTGTETVFVKLEHEGRTGYGEATLPPYLPENPAIVIEQIKVFYNQVRSSPGLFTSLLPSGEIFPATCCALEEAYFSCFRNYNTGPSPSAGLHLPSCTFTIGIGTEDEDQQKIREASEFSVIKVKLGNINDRARIKKIASATDKTICVDMNQGLTNRKDAEDLTCYLADAGVTFIEQPFVRDDYESHRWLKKRSPIPVIADESIKNMNDFMKYGTSFDGINVKLIKCGGPSAAMDLLTEAKERGYYRILGCMSESSCGIFHASHLQHLADLADLDGPWLIRNDPFSGVYIKDGRLNRTKLELKEELDFVEL